MGAPLNCLYYTTNFVVRQALSVLIVIFLISFCFIGCSP
nr:MAG TPA: hypothetical protein [Caudoviricetes sp.]